MQAPTRRAVRSFASLYAPLRRRNSPMPSDKPVVHVIDDDKAVRESLAFLLGTVRIDVQTYESANAFLEVASKVQGIIITDVRMPGLSGIDLLRRVRELRLDVPVIVITGHGDV